MTVHNIFSKNGHLAKTSVFYLKGSFEKLFEITPLRPSFKIYCVPSLDNLVISKEASIIRALFIIQTTFRFRWVGGLRTDGCSN